MASIADKSVNYVKDSYNEMRKVVWPTRRELISHTLIIIVFSVIIAFFLSTLDMGFTYVVEKILSLGK